MQPLPFTGGQAAERTFRPPLMPRILSSLFLAAVLGALIGLLLPNALPNSLLRSTRAAIVVGVIVVLVVLIVVGLVLGTTRIVVTPTTVQVRRPGRVVHTWERSQAQFTSHVVRRTTNGIPSGSTRTLIVRTRDGETKVALPGMGREAFNTMLAELAPLSAPQADLRADRASTADLPRMFEVNRAFLQSRARTSLVVTLGLAAVAVVGALLAFVVLAGDETSIIPSILWPIAGIGAVVMLVVTSRQFARAAVTPARITVSTAGIAVDDVMYGFASMSRIWLSPPAYASQRVRLEAPTGDRRVLPLGGGDAGYAAQVFPDYDVLLDAVHRASAQYPGLLALDRE